MLTAQLGLLESQPGNIEPGLLPAVTVASLDADSALVAYIRTTSSFVPTATQAAKVPPRVLRRPAAVQTHEYAIIKKR